MGFVCAQSRPQFILSFERGLGNGVRTHINSKGKNPLYRRLRGGSNPRRSITQDTELNTLLTELFRPPIQWRGSGAFFSASFCKVVCMEFDTRLVTVVSISLM